MEYVILALLLLNAVLLAVLLLQNNPSKRKQEQQAMQAQLSDEIRRSDMPKHLAGFHTSRGNLPWFCRCSERTLVLSNEILIW